MTRTLVASLVLAPCLLSGTGLLTCQARADTWTIEVVDPSCGNNMGGWLSNSLALDANNLPHISYHDLQSSDLAYAHFDGSTWTLQTLASAGSVGRWNSLALDSSGRPRISYYDETNARLMYAAFNGSSWQHQVVDAGGRWNSLALDSSGNARIGYMDPTGVAKYAAWNGSDWQVQTIANTGYWNGTNSLAIDANGNPHISYKNNYELHYASWNGSAWDIQEIDGGGNNHLGKWSSLELDSAGRPHISYQGKQERELKYATWNGSAWEIEVLESGTYLAGGTSLALDARGLPQISYFDYPFELKYTSFSAAVPEPSTLALLGTGAIALMVLAGEGKERLRPLFPDTGVHERRSDSEIRGGRRAVSLSGQGLRATRRPLGRSTVAGCGTAVAGAG